MFSIKLTSKLSCLKKEKKTSNLYFEVKGYMRGNFSKIGDHYMFLS